jgi:DNA repair protein RadC
MGHADQRRLRGTRQLRKSVTELTHVDTQQLSETEKVGLAQHLQLANMRLQAARKRTLQAKAHSQKAVVANDQVLADLASAQEALQKVWKRIK